MPRTCSVKNCTADVKHKFKFPQANTDKERFLKWLSASGNSSLLSFSIKQLRTKGICEIHFESKYMLAKKLTTTAVPTLHLPAKIEVSAYKIVENNNIEYQPPKKRSKDNETDFRFESDQQNILQHETERLDYTVFDADAENSPVDKILSINYVNGKQGWTGDDKQKAKPTLVEESINIMHLQGVPEKTIVRKTQSTSPVEEILSTIYVNGKQEWIGDDEQKAKPTLVEESINTMHLHSVPEKTIVRKTRFTSPVRTNEQQAVGNMCTLCKAFVKAGMRTHLVKLHEALEENPSEDTKNFVRNQLQALTIAICKRVT